MSLNKENSVITTQPETANARLGEPAPAGPGYDTPLVPPETPIDATPPAAPPKEMTAAVPDWVAAYPAKHEGVLRQYGIRPSDHPAATEYNARLVERAEAGLNGQDLADAADTLFDELIFEREIDPDVEAQEADTYYEPSMFDEIFDPDDEG